MKRKGLNHVILAIAVLLIASLACSSSNEGTVITPVVQENEQVTVPETESEKESQPAFEVFDVGDLIEVKEHTIRLNSVEYQGSLLVANFTLENQGSSDLNVSSILSFSAKREDGTLLDQEYFDCGTSGLDGSVLPSDKLRGDVCWADAKPEDGIKIYYEANLLSTGAIVWNATEGVAEELVTDGGPTSQVEMFKVGDLIQGNSLSIRLNSVEYQGMTLVTDFTIENLGNSDVNVSSIVSFSAKRNDGTLLEQEYFDCGSSTFDGKVLPGDRLTGAICWTEADVEDGIRIFYEEDLFSDGAIVWDAASGVAEDLMLPDAQLKVETFNVGDIIQVQDQTIVLNNVGVQGSTLKANFTIENNGSSDLNVSSILSFYARKRDGSTLEQEYFSCGTSFDGSVIPGDKLTGDICWLGASLEDGIKIYYEAQLFTSGAIVWIVK